MQTVIRYIKKKFHFLWRIIESVNSFIVNLLYKKEYLAIKKRINDSKFSNEISVHLANDENLKDIHNFLSKADEEDIKYFRPFDFDQTSIHTVAKNSANQFYYLSDDSGIIGLFFLRFFANKQAYLGFYIDKSKRGQGIGTQILSLLVQAFQKSTLLLSATVSKHNTASLKSHLKTGFVLSKELKDNYVLLQSPRNNGKQS